MPENTNEEMKARVTVDEENHVRQIAYEEPWESSQESPLLAAIEYLQQMGGVMEVPATETQNLSQQVSFVEPTERGVEYRLGQQKQLFDATTIIFNQTFLNVPVWRAGITLTIRHNPNRVVMVTDSSEQGMNATLPSPERIQEHRRIFALAAAERQLRALGLSDALQNPESAESAPQPSTASFVRQVTGQATGTVAGEAMADEAPQDNAYAIRGRFFVYRYDASKRIPSHTDASATLETPEAAPEDAVEQHITPVLKLPPVNPSIEDGHWYLVSEVTFSLTTPEYGPLNWRVLVDVQTDSVLYLEPLVGALHGLVFPRDPISVSGNIVNKPNQDNTVLNAFRISVVLPNLDAPVNGMQPLKGSFAVVSNVEAPNINPPVLPANTEFNFDVRTDDFAAVNAYYHTDRFFALVESLGFPIATYFNGTVFPVRVDHRDNAGELSDIINARCVGNGVGGIGFAGYALNDLSNLSNPIGRACDSRVHLHELGGHGILYEHVGTANFGFAHSAGDSLSAILHDPESRAPDRFLYAPWHPTLKRRFDRAVAQGWAWGGANDDRGYQSEEILATTLFRVYRTIGGDSTDIVQRRFASRVTMYLILRAVGILTPTSNPRNALGFANALIEVDKLDWTSEGVFGGAYNKVIRWSFEKQGLYQAPGAPTVVTQAGKPPAVDVYIDDGRAGEYAYQAEYWNNPSIWNRTAADGGSTHQEPIAGMTNFAYVRVKNRGTQSANNVRVSGFHRTSPLGTIWPNDFQPLTTSELLVGTLAANNAEEKIVGPYTWTPLGSAPGQDGLLMIVSALNDESNVMHFTGSDSVPEWRLVPNDNNIGLRRVAVVGGGGEQSAGIRATTDAMPAENAVKMAEQLLQTLGLAGTKPKHVQIKGVTLQIDFEGAGGTTEITLSVGEVAPMMAAEAFAEAEWGMRRHAAIATAAMERLHSERAREKIVRILDENGEASLGEAAHWADRLRGSDRPRDPATDRFLGELRNRDHNRWHYVNLPLGLDGYDRQRHPEFTRSDDVVQMTLLCVESLRNPGPRARFEEIIALRWLSHLIGDLHQPVHIGCGYIANAETDQARFVSDPNEAIGLPNDRGGNDLVLPIGGNLHSFWDSKLGPDLVPDAVNAASDDVLVQNLIDAPVPAVAHEAMSIAEQVIGWTNASLEATRAAYQGLRITGYHPASAGDYPVEWEGEAAYRQRCAPVVSERMAAAVANLATLFDSIWP